MKLLRGFYARSVLVVARDCIGKLLVHRVPEGETAAVNTPIAVIEEDRA